MNTRSFHIILISMLSMPAMAQSVKITHKPEAALVERVDGRNVANFDLIIENTGTDTLQVTKVVMRSFDKKGALINEKFLDANGTAPSIALLSKREVLPRSTVNVFNPFPEMNPAAAKLELTFSFHNNLTVSHRVTPEIYHQKFTLILPVKGRTLVYDGHDANAHHRRFDYEFTPIKQLGFTTNFMRYAYDFVSVDDNGNPRSGEGDANANWLSFGSDVIAVADGIVEAVVTGKADDRQFDMSVLKDNKMELFGNYVTIRHHDRLFSIYGHLRQGTSSLKVGDKVRQGQKIGEIGASGSAFMPHLHFEMRDGSSANAEGIPSYFSNFTILAGSEKLKIRHGTVNSGDIFISDAK